MASLNLFQQYSQQENTVTNNVVLMLSLLYDCNSNYYEKFVNGILESDQAYSATPEFKQQVGGSGGGIMDGHIFIPASRIIIETKLNRLEWIEKLLRYTKNFKEGELQILLHLSSERYSDAEAEEIGARLRSDDRTNKARFKSLTYKDLSDNLNSLKEEYPFDPQLARIAGHFEEYCQNSKLFPREEHILRAMACGQSYDLNVKHRFYFDLANRGYSPFKYLGIYYKKAVQHIGSLEVIVEADYVDGKLIVKEGSPSLTPDQEQRLIAAIDESIERGWTVDRDHRFFLLKEFATPKFRKESPGGIFRVRYFNLKDYLSTEVLDQGLAAIAEGLSHKTWK